VNYTTINNYSLFEVTGNTVGTPAQPIDFAISGNIPYIIINQSGNQVNGFDQAASSTFSSASSFYRGTIL